MKLIKMLLLPVLFVAMWSLTGCNEEPTTSVTPDTTPGLSKLTIPAGAVIESATFNIRVGDPENHNITVHNVNVSWDESETWDDFYGKSAIPFDSVNSLGGFSAATSGLKTIETVDFKALVQAWVDGTTPNNGLLLNQPVAGGWINNYYSKEYGTGDSAAFLDVTYSFGGELVIVKDFAFVDTYISTLEPGTPHGDEILLLNGRPLADYIKHVLVQFDIETTPGGCFQEETAWAANGNEPLKLRYTNRGNWATYVQYAEKTVNIYAGRTNYAGTAEFSAVVGGKVTITISLEDGWELNPDEGSETVKIQGYNSAPSGNPAPGLFNTYKGNSLTITVPAFNFYGIHLDVRKPINCP